MSFPKHPPTKKINVPFKILVEDKDEPVTVYDKVVGIECLPFMIHRKSKFTNGSEEWYLTHSLTGYTMGIRGTYKYCKAVATCLLEYPVMYMPSHRLMSEHPDFADTQRVVGDLAETFQYLNPPPSLPSE